jgi:two-component system phosphate regulon sensor histidine kinase PhoR
MHFRSIRWRIAVPYVVLILASMLGLSLYVSDRLRSVRLADLEAQLVSDARLIASEAAPMVQKAPDVQALDALAKERAGALGVRVTIIGPDGTVLGESDRDRAQLDNHLGRPEVQQALEDGMGSSIRFSQTVGYEMMYVALRPSNGSAGEAGTVVRVAVPLRQIQAEMNELRRMVLTGAVLAALGAVLLAVVIAERTAKPVRRLTRVAGRLAEGDLNAQLFPATHDEVGQLTQAFNHMAEQLREKVTSLAAERGRLAAVLENMADGVLITDTTGRIKLINPAAASLLKMSQERALELTFPQAVRHHELIEMWHQCWDRQEEQIATVEFGRQGPFVQAILTPLREREARGYLIILQDLTRIRRLETVRRDFISNVSHELRTPLAGLKALVETLRDGALEDPPAAQRFLNRMDAEVDTLTQMVQELLELSRVESGQAPLRLTPTRVEDLLDLPMERLHPQAERAELQTQLVLSPTLPPVLADAERVQQVVTNLVHNAIKFTPAGGSITVSAERQGDEVVISVRDTGVGINADDLTRIFERFYKADRARSGGGTGLGLAIAKHIVRGHGGHIWAESVEGQGSTFHFTLPVAA